MANVEISGDGRVGVMFRRHGSHPASRTFWAVCLPGYLASRSSFALDIT
jgi:hypothetical protein